MDKKIKKVSFLPLIFWSTIIFFISFIMFFTLHETKRYIYVHSFIHSDFMAHIPIIKSFLYGGNFHPIEYPLFVGEKINYHYGFHIMAAFLERLGLPFSYSVNILSITGFLGFLFFMYLITKYITNDKIAPYIAVLLPFFDFSFVWLVYILKHGQNWLIDIPKLKFYVCFGPWDGSIISAFWNLNIYLNQRHLAMGFALTFLSIYLIAFMFYKVDNLLKKLFIIFLNMIILISLVYIHKGMLIITLLFWGIYIGVKTLYLFFLWIKNKKQEIPANLKPQVLELLYLSLGILASFLLVLFFLELAYSQFTRPDGLKVIRIFLGFLYTSSKVLRPLKISKFLKWLIYTLANLGILPFLGIIGFILSLKEGNENIRLANISIFLLSWVVFAMANIVVFSLEVAINHKFINFSILIWEMYTAYVFVKLFKAKILAKTFLFIIIFMLLFNFVLDYSPIFNSYAIMWEKENYNPVSKWILSHTDPKDKFLNITYDVSSIEMAGRRIFFGWDYFAMSAGYNTYKRRSEYYSFLKIYKTKPLLARKRLCKIMKKHNLKYVFLRGKDKFIDLNIDANELAKTLFSGIKPLYHDDITYIYSYGEICKKKQ